MELLLNAIWVMTVTAALVSLMWRSQRIERKQLSCSLGALLCASALLLPAISVTDDLHYSEVLFQDTNSTKRLVSGIAHIGVLVPVFGFGAVVAKATIGLDHFVVRSLTISIIPTYRPPVPAAPLPSRAPPHAVA